MAAVVCSAVVIAGCAPQRIREESRSQMRAGHYEQAAVVLESGLQTYPDSALLRAGLLETRAETLARVLAQASAARAEGRLDDAEQTLMRASALQPQDPRIEAMRSQIVTDRRQQTALERARVLVDQRRLEAASAAVVEALKAQPRHPELQALKRRIEAEQRQGQIQASQLGLAETRPISIDFRDANLRTVLDAVTRNSGINFVFDKDVRSDVRVTVYLRSVRVEDAVELIASTNQLARKVIDSRTVLIYPNTPEKQREHQEQVVRVFHLSNGDAKGAAAFLKSMLKIREPYVDERTNMLALRDSEANVQMAERLLLLFDTAEPEVLLEVEVIEINTTRLTELGVKFPDFFALTLLPPLGAERLTLGNVRGVTRDRIGLSIGGITVNLKRETGDFNMLANPRIRVRSKEKARVLVGDKIPIVTTTQGSTGFVSDSVSYIDVGLKLDVEPTVYVDDEVAIRIGLEVSSLGSVIKTASGTLAYQIGTRNASTLLRLRDGETQLLAGLISTAERSDASKVPGLGDLPVAGRLFSSQLDNGQRVELVLSITPRVLRSVRRPDIAEAEIWVGTEASPRLRPVGGLATSVAAGIDRPAAGHSSSASTSGGEGQAMSTPWLPPGLRDQCFPAGRGADFGSADGLGVGIGRGVGLCIGLCIGPGIGPGIDLAARVVGRPGRREGGGGVRCPCRPPVGPAIAGLAARIRLQQGPARIDRDRGGRTLPARRRSDQLHPDDRCRRRACQCRRPANDADRRHRPWACAHPALQGAGRRCGGSRVVGHASDRAGRAGGRALPAATPEAGHPARGRGPMTRPPWLAGYTLVELLAVMTVVGILAVAVWPMAEIASRRDRERDLKRALWEIRDAIDAYKRAADAGAIAVRPGETGYPESLESLVTGTSDARLAGRAQRFLRRVPRDPFAPEDVPAPQTWALRSYQSPPDRPRPGADVYDVASRSERIGLNGVALKEW